MSLKMHYALVCFLIFSPKTFAANSYTITDLEILQGQKSYDEFLGHAKDILPSKRDKSWYEMLSDMGTGLIDQKRRVLDFKRSTFQQIEKLAMWPEFKRDEFFQVKREGYTQEYLKNCFANNRPVDCEKDMQTFWKTSRKESETGYQLMLLSLGFFPQKNSFNYIEKMVKLTDSKFYCDKPMVQRVFFKNILTNDSFLQTDLNKENQKVALNKIQNLAHPNCWEKLRPALKDKVMSEPDSKLYTLAHHMKVLNGEDNAFWLTRNFLKTPRQGAILNMAWNELEKLSQDYYLRGRVFMRLKAIDPLPGNIFSKNQGKFQRTLTRHFSKNFPEYISHYSKECIQYLSGEKEFERGNPTMECHDLFSLDQKNKSFKEKMISQELHFKYSAIQKKVKR